MLYHTLLYIKSYQSESSYQRLLDLEGAHNFRGFLIDRFSDLENLDSLSTHELESF